ncbi:Uncharacterised protein [Mycobacteroides abscessus]|nr:Uncharacterised protein [Mycobacteroides abscessus]
MTFEPVLPWWIFIVLAVVIVALRMYTLYRVLVVGAAAVSARLFCVGAC